MGIHNLENVLQPKSIAVIGASEKKGSIGNTLIHNIISNGYDKPVFPVNPKSLEIMNLKAFRSISDIGDPVDLALIATPINTVPDILRECAVKEVKGAVILSSGGKEIGEKGREIEKKILEESRKSGIRIIGPNCLGIINAYAGMNATFADYRPNPGKMALISQSGAICTAILDLSEKEDIGLGHVISLGSMIDVDFGDIIDYLGGDYRVNSIVVYMENLSRFRNFMSAARAVSRVKPIIVYKAGRSRSGAMAAASHTGALAGEDAVYDAAFKRAGILRVHTFEELFDCAELLARERPPKGSGLAILTNAGGPGVMAADALALYGAEPVRLTPETIAKLDEILPAHWSRGNPIDMLGDATPERYVKAVEICMDAKEINGLLILMVPQSITDPVGVASALVDLWKHKMKRVPIITSWLGGGSMEKGREVFNRAGVATFDTSERAVRAFMDLWRYAGNIEMLWEIPEQQPAEIDPGREQAASMVREKLASSETCMLTEIESKKLLSFFHIPVTRMETAKTEEDAVAAAYRIGFPVVMKIDSRDIAHKSDAGGVKINLTDEAAVKTAYRHIMAGAKKYNPDAVIEGVSLQPMVESGDHELILGVKKDRDFGPVILFGMGGILTEILKDRALALPPINRLLARRLMEETKVFRLLKGYRNIPPADLETLENLLVCLSQLVIDIPEIQELDMNPVIASKKGTWVADARILLKRAEKPSPLHMVISPYPRHQEKRIRREGVGELLVRPIRPEDAGLFTELFESLSPRSIYYRFFSPVKKLSSDMLSRFTQIDYDRQISLVAIKNINGEEKMLGAARIIPESKPDHAEFAVMVSDEWHGKGIGAELLQGCLDIAQERQITSAWGLVLAENKQMLYLGRKLGFIIKRIPDSPEFELRLDFENLKKEKE